MFITKVLFITSNMLWEYSNVNWTKNSQCDSCTNRIKWLKKCRKSFIINKVGHMHCSLYDIQLFFSGNVYQQFDRCNSISMIVKTTNVYHSILNVIFNNLSKKCFSYWRYYFLFFVKEKKQFFHINADFEL